MGYKKSPRSKKATAETRSMPTAESWRTPRKSDYGRMVKPSEIIAELDRAAEVRMADQEPVPDGG